MSREVRGEKLTSEEFDRCSEAFNTFVVENGFGKIDNLWKLRNVLQALGQCPTDEEMSHLLYNGTLEFDDFIKVIEQEKARFSIPPPPDSDTIQAFVAMGGGGADGEVSAGLLRRMVKNFDLRLDIDKLIEEVDTDKSGAITYEEFANMFATVDNQNGLSRERVQPKTGDSKSQRKSRERKTHSVYYSLSDYNKWTPPETVSDMSFCDRETIKKLPHTTPLPEKTAVIASGAKKTSEQRPMTSHELLAIKLKRLERTTKRIGCIGGELPAIQMSNKLPAIYLHRKRISEMEKQRKHQKEERAAAASNRGHVYPYQRREVIDMETVLELLTIQSTSMRTWDSGQPKVQRYHEKREGLSKSLQAAVRCVQHGNLLALSNTNLQQRPSSQTSPIQTDGIDAIRTAIQSNRARTSHAKRDFSFLLDKTRNAKQKGSNSNTAGENYSNQLIRRLCSAASILQPLAGGKTTCVS